jgi:hypothetical membrane protein
MKIEKKFEKVKISHFIILILISSMGGIFGALIFYLPHDPSYSIFSNYVSDLGAGPLEAKISLGLGMILTGVLLIFVVLYITMSLRKEDGSEQLISTYLGTGILASIAMIMVGIFPLDPSISFAYEAHRIVAMLYFGSAGTSLISLGYLQYKSSGFSTTISITSFLAGFVALVFDIGFVVQEYTATPRQAIVYFTEWTSFMLFMIWLIIHGLYFWKAD